MKNSKKIAAYFCSWILYVSSLAMADDTDIYVRVSGTTGNPHLMFVLDYRSELKSNFCSVNGANACVSILNTDEALRLLQEMDVTANGVPGDADNDGVGDNAIAAAAAGDANFDGLRDSAADMTNFSATKLNALAAVLKVVFEKFDGINVGMMVSNYDGGGTVLYGYNEFLSGDSNGAKARLVNIVNSIPQPGSASSYHENQPKELHYEWYQYINGDDVEFGDNTAGNFNSTNSPANDTSIYSGGVGNRSYTSPFASNPSDFECSKLYSVYATSANEGGSDSDLTAEITADFSADAAANFTNMLEYMSNNDMLTNVNGTQELKTWIISSDANNPNAEDYATAAGTIDQYMQLDGESGIVNIQKTLEAVFIEALSVSTTFVAASVPVNVFNRVQTLDNFYIALFEAKTNARWPGNLKKLKLADTDGDGVFDDIIDARNASAFSADDGRIKYESLTFWTDAGDLPPADADANEVTDRDGRAVERGGAGQQIPGFVSGSPGTTNVVGGRNLYYEPSSAGSFVPFNADAATASTLQSYIGSATATDALYDIAWARGVDVDDEDTDGIRNEARDWILGDAIHSRPLAINFGATTGYSQSNPDIRLFMGTNDGFFHMFKNTETSGSDSGKEGFAFMPRELMDNIPTLRANSTTDHLYGVDGEPVALVIDNDLDGTIETADSDSVYVYFGLRRGGKAYYAVDFSNPNSPRYMGKIDNTTTGFTEMGMSFSKPKVVKVRYEGNTVDALIFAGGYDTNKDSTASDPDGNGGADSEGNAIYVVNASTLGLIWKAKLGGSTGAVSNTEYNHTSMRASIPSEIMPLDADRNGIVDRLYVGDMAGQVWRIDLPEGNNSSDTNHRRNNWEATVFARLGTGSGSTDLRFFHRPDVVQTKDASGDYEAIVISSGDRANPLEDDDENQLIYLKDRNTTSGNPSSTTITLSDLADVDSCTSCTATDYRYGWRVELDDDGEKGLSSPLVANGKVFFTSYVPNDGSNSCAPAEGSGKLYVLEASDGEESFSGSSGIDVGPGIPASPIALGGEMILLPGTGIGDVDVPGIIGDGKLVNLTGKSVWQLYWRSTGKDSL